MIDVVTAVAGGWLVVLTWLSVVRTVLTQGRVPPRAARWTVRLTAAVVMPVGARLPAGSRERLLALCAPLSLFVLFAVWFLGSATGFAMLAVAFEPARADFDELFALTRDGSVGVLGFGVVVSGALLLGVFVVHLVRITDAYNRRERLVTRLSVQAASPSDAERVIATYVWTDSRDRLDQWFAEWADWLADVRRTHVSHPALVYLRPTSELCWLEAAVIVLDAAALVEAAAPDWAPPNTRTLLETGASCLQRLAADVGIVMRRPAVSLHGREQCGFADTIRLARFAGLPVAYGEAFTWEGFQRERTRYAPYAAALVTRLRYRPDAGRTVLVPSTSTEQCGEW